MPTVAERVTVNPTTEDPTLVPLDFAGLDRSWGIYLLGHEYPPPDLEVLHSSSADTEGDPVVSSRYLNRIITAKVRIFEPEDAAAVNLVTNPSVELNETGWSLSSGGWTGASRPREEAPAALKANGSDYAIHVKGTHELSEVVKFLTLETLGGTSGFPVEAGKTYTMSGYVYAVDPPVNIGGNKNLLAEIQWYDAAGVSLALNGTQWQINAGEVKRVSYTKEAPAGAAFAKIRFVAQSATSGDVVDWWIDRAQLELGAVATAYVDGDMPGCDWTGARHASKSSRPAPDGTRFSRIVRDVTAILDGIKTRKAGVLRRISALGGPLYYDLRTAKLTEAPQDMGIGMKRAELGLAFEALPGGRGTEIQIGGNFDELTKPVLSFLAENVPGELPALGRLVLEDRQGQNQAAVWLGAQRDTYSSSADAELFYEAETRKLLGGAEVAVLAGSSGAEGKAVKSGPLVNTYQPVVSTQAATGNHATHVGSYRVLARIWRPASFSEVSVKLAWTEGDFVNFTENEAKTWAGLEQQEHFGVVDLGVVTIQPGAQRWEGRILAKSNVTGERIYVDCLMFIPVSECAGEARATTPGAAPSAVSAYDDFNQAAGVLAGKSADVGGVWAGAGSANDFSVVAGTSHWLQRTAVSDAAGTPRYALLGATKYTDAFARVNMWSSNPESGLSTNMGLMLRYVDTNNWLALMFFVNAISTEGVNGWVPRLYKKVAGVKTQMNLLNVIVSAPKGTPITPQTLELMVLANGYWQVGANGKLLSNGVDAALSSTGALKEGLVGLLDEKTNAVAETRYYDHLEAYVPIVDQSIYANRQLELRSDRARRQDKEGLTWGSAPYKGDYLLVPQAGPEKKPTRFICKASRNPDFDDGIDDIRAQLFVTPRYLMAPPT